MTLRRQIIEGQRRWRTNIAMGEEHCDEVVIRVDHFKAMLDWIDEMRLELKTMQSVIDGKIYVLEKRD